MLCFPLLLPPFPFKFLSRQHRAELENLGLRPSDSQTQRGSRPCILSSIGNRLIDTV